MQLLHNARHPSSVPRAHHLNSVQPWICLLPAMRQTLSGISAGRCGFELTATHLYLQGVVLLVALRHIYWSSVVGTLRWGEGFGFNTTEHWHGSSDLVDVVHSVRGKR